MGFTGPVKGGLIEQLGVNLDNRGNIATDATYMSSLPGVFAAGDMRSGQSLVVWAIVEGRNAAEGIDRYLKTRWRSPWSARFRAWGIDTPPVARASACCADTRVGVSAFKIIGAVH
jgi:pyruvate/2-oxoglutarate dehydrogenase complex dihydrolipoamide dehydrogenase (E3) component